MVLAAGENFVVPALRFSERDTRYGVATNAAISSYLFLNPCYLRGIQKNLAGGLVTKIDLTKFEYCPLCRP